MSQSGGNNVTISEMASTLKDNWTNIMAYRGTVFTEDFEDDLRRFVDPITDALRRVDNKDKLDTDPPDAKDVLQILKAINFYPWVEDLFTDAFNAVGPVLMMAVHVLVINCHLRKIQDGPNLQKYDPVSHRCTCPLVLLRLRVFLLLCPISHLLRGLPGSGHVAEGGPRCSPLFVFGDDLIMCVWMFPISVALAYRA